MIGSLGREVKKGVLGGRNGIYISRDKEKYLRMVMGF